MSIQSDLEILSAKLQILKERQATAFANPTAEAQADATDLVSDIEVIVSRMQHGLFFALHIIRNNLGQLILEFEEPEVGEVLQSPPTTPSIIIVHEQVDPQIRNTFVANILKYNQLLNANPKTDTVTLVQARNTIQQALNLHPTLANDVLPNSIRKDFNL